MASVQRTNLGGRLEAFVIAGATGLIAAGMALMLGRQPRKSALA